MPDDTNKLLKQVLAELQAIRRNQEAQMPSGMVEQTRMQRVPVQAEETDPQSRVDSRLANLKTKGS